MIKPDCQKPVLIFDSGIGGLTVFKEVRILVPDYNFIYIADDSAFPYGKWEDDQLKQHLISLFSKIFEQYDPVLCIIACNTAFTLVGADLRAKFPLIPFVGTVPAIKPAAERTLSGFVSVLSTAGTIRRAYTHDLIQSFASKCNVQLVGSKNLASIVEDFIRGKPIDDEEIRSEIHDCFVEQGKCRTDIIVLACTHYPFIINILRRLAFWPVDWLDPADAIARRVRSLLPRIASEQITSCREIALFTSGIPDFSVQRFMQGFGFNIKKKHSINSIDS
ncbi:glutamate racemase [Liberibacter crescens]|nr:glutamate racemase [Liberibacter crescens]AMC13338.1 glutamate racemase [Liberibacter crescens]